jgi:hypothetical protein
MTSKLDLIFRNDRTSLLRLEGLSVFDDPSEEGLSVYSSKTGDAPSGVGVHGDGAVPLLGVSGLDTRQPTSGHQTRGTTYGADAFSTWA